MQIRAENDPRYSRRFLYMGIFALAFGLYCLYDGAIGYPGHRVRGFEDFKAGDKTYFIDDHRKAMTVDQFEADADADPEIRKHWETFAHEGDIKGHPDIVLQYVMAAGCGLLGAFLISIPLRARGRWIEASDTGITSSWGESFKFEEVEEVNKRQWRKKGIAKVTYVANNRRRTFVVDDYKFDRYATDAILYELEQRIEPGRIVNGPPEPEPEPDGEVAKAVQAGGGHRQG